MPRQGQNTNDEALTLREWRRSLAPSSRSPRGAPALLDRRGERAGGWAGSTGNDTSSGNAKAGFAEHLKAQRRCLAVLLCNDGGKRGGRSSPPGPDFEHSRFRIHSLFVVRIWEWDYAHQTSMCG